MKILHSMWMRGWENDTRIQDVVASKSHEDFGMLCNQWLMWYASCLFANRTFGNIHLLCDTVTTSIVEYLDFPYTTIDQSVDKLASRRIPHELYAWGKIGSYAQDEPFLHIDWDVFLMKKLPLEFVNAPVVCQESECLRWISTYQGIYRKFVRTMPKSPISWLQCSPRACPYNAGIVGGNDLDFWHRYVYEVESTLDEAGVSVIMSEFNGWERAMCMFLLEQYTLGTLSDVVDQPIMPLLPSDGKAHGMFGCKTGREICHTYGYAHLLDEKNHPVTAWQSSDFFGRLHKRLQDEFTYEYNMFMDKMFTLRRNVVGSSVSTSVASVEEGIRWFDKDVLGKEG